MRQGDPLSPYLFLFCSEGLACLLKRATRDGVLHGLSVSYRGPQVSHCFFADDSLLFCRATPSDCEVICDILRQYEAVSGQQINLDKTCIFFSPYTSTMVQSTIMQLLGVVQLHSIDRYLEFPLDFGRSKKFHLRAIKEKLEKSILSYRE